jgi:hypothetical protein
VPITNNVVSLNSVRGVVYSIQHYVIKFWFILIRVSKSKFSKNIINNIWQLTVFKFVVKDMPTTIVCLVWFMMSNATFGNISVISWWWVLFVEETGVPGEKHRSVASHWQTLSHNVVSSTPRLERSSNSQRYWW